MGNKSGRYIELKRVIAPDGNLVVAEVKKEIPFKVNRIFWIYNTPEGVTRANHACKKSDFLLICLQGKVKVMLDSGRGKSMYSLEDSNKGLLIPKMTWIKTYDFSKDAILLVMASEIYQKDRYFNDYQEFLEEIKKRFD